MSEALVDIAAVSARFEMDAVMRWRYEELVRAGYDDAAAVDVAYHLEIDLHAATDLVRRGCPSGIALRILM